MENASSEYMRNARSQLARCALLLVACGERLARIRAAGRPTYATTKFGARIDVATDPSIEECERGVSIQRAGAVRLLREASHIQDPLLYGGSGNSF